ncbi:MAG: sigma-70 family RNA polymerase sigma factor [Bacteroidota bacterium]
MKRLDEPHGYLGSNPHQFVLYVLSKYDKILKAYAKGLLSNLKSNFFSEQDLMSDFYIRIYESFETVRAGYEKRKVSYFRVMIRNLYFQVIRGNRGRMDFRDGFKEMSEESFEGGLEIINQLQVADTLNAYHEAQKNELHREIMHLRQNGYKHREISELLGMKINTISSILKREKKKIEDLMKE